MKSDEINDVNDDYDILIVGGGPAGLSTWMHLKKYAPDLADKTLLIEKEKYPRDKICGGGLGAWSYQVLKSLDIKLDIPILPVSDIEFIYNNERHTLHQNNQLLMTKRSEFDNLLVNTGRRRGLQLNENESIIGLKKIDDAIKVKTNKNTYKVNVLIGADGSLSKVRKLANFNKNNHLATTIEVFSPSKKNVDSEFMEKKATVDLSYIDDGLQGYFWHVPSIHDNVPMIAHGLANFKLLDGRKKANLKHIFDSELKSRKITIPQNNWLSHPIRWYGKNDDTSKPHVLLVGDAIGIEPAFGGGIHFALSYGSLASKAIKDAFDTSDFSFSNYKQRIDNHLIGKFIRKCENLGKKMFSNELNPIDVAVELFTID